MTDLTETDATQPPGPTTADGGHGHRHLGWALAIICTAQLMVVLDATIANIALPYIQADLDFSAHALPWIITAYALTFGGFLLLGGKVGDMFGRRRAFVLGLTIFAVASLVGGFAQNEAMLLGSRAAQGLGGLQADPLTQSLAALFGSHVLRLPIAGAMPDDPAPAELHAADDPEDEAERATACVRMGNHLIAAPDRHALDVADLDHRHASSADRLAGKGHSPDHADGAPGAPAHRHRAVGGCSVQCPLCRGVVVLQATARPPALAVRGFDAPSQAGPGRRAAKNLNAGSPATRKSPRRPRTRRPPAGGAAARAARR